MVNLEKAWHPNLPADGYQELFCLGGKISQVCKDCPRAAEELCQIRQKENKNRLSKQFGIAAAGIEAKNTAGVKNLSPLQIHIHLIRVPQAEIYLARSIRMAAASRMSTTPSPV